MKVGVDYNLLGMNMGELAEFAVGKILAALKKGRRPLSIMIWGPPGVGKTMTVYEMGRMLTKSLGVEVEVYVNATSCLEPTDIAGVPTPIEINGQTRYTAYLAPHWAYMISEQYQDDQRVIRNDPEWLAPPAIVFFDDIPAAHFQTQTAFFKGIHEGHWGDMRARVNVTAIAAGNRIEDNAGANEMPTALASRFQHCYANPSVDDWVRWAQIQGGVHPFVVGYIRQNKGELHTFNDEVASQDEKAFATPRTWEMVSDTLNDEVPAYSSGSMPFLKAISGLIGYANTTKFLAYLRNTNAVVSPEEIVKNPKKAKMPDKKNIDALGATIASLEAHIRRTPKDWEAAVIYATRKDMISDFGIILAHTAMEVVMEFLDQDAMTEALGSDALEGLLDRYEDILSYAKA